MYYMAVVCTECTVYIFSMCIFKCMLCPNDAPGVFEFLYMNAFSLIYESGGNDLKATGDVATFTYVVV